MPDAPRDRDLTPEALRREKAAREASPPYWVHPTVTVYEYRHMKRAEQDEVNRECRAIVRASQKQ